MQMYSLFSRIYDRIEADYSWCENFLREQLRLHALPGSSILELGCGTGNILRFFADDYAVSGLDLSAINA